MLFNGEFCSQDIENLLENVGIMQLLEIDGYLLRIQQRLRDIQPLDMRYFHDAGDLIHTKGSQNV